MAETLVSPQILWPLLITLIAPLGILLARRNPNLREGVSFLAGLLTFLAMLSLVPDVLAGRLNTYTLFTLLPGITVSFAVDGLSILFGLVASFLWMLATCYNIGYMRTLKEHAQTRYFFCFAVAIFGAVGLAFSSNIFTLYLFYEVITVCTYPLVFHHQDEEAEIGARKYLIYLMGTSKLFLLPAMVLTYVLAGTLDMNMTDMLTGMFPAEVVAANPGLVITTYVLFIAGLAKAAIMPFHNWLPSAMVAPTPVSALLHAVAVVKAGVFAISRVILSIFGVENMDLLYLGLPTAYLVSFTILMASIIALSKNNLKAMLAYSTVGQLSYVIVGVAMLSPLAVSGGLIHIANHAFSKITLFFCAGAIYVAAHKKEISEMSGLGRAMPFTFGAFAIGALSMIGVPPVAGFVTKWYLLLGSMEAEQLGILLVLITSTLLNVGYFAPVVIKAFFGKTPEGANYSRIQEAPLTMVVPLLIAATISVVIGIYPEIMMSFVKAVTG
jgi:multicomponent Na+:H+ antiporter subunit D